MAGTGALSARDGTLTRRASPHRTELTTENPLWVGAWWVGFLGAGAAAFLTAIPILGYPRQLPGGCVPLLFLWAGGEPGTIWPGPPSCRAGLARATDHGLHPPVASPCQKLLLFPLVPGCVLLLALSHLSPLGRQVSGHRAAAPYHICPCARHPGDLPRPGSGEGLQAKPSVPDSH